MPIFSTSSLTDMPLVRLSELIMSSRWVRPISEIKRWFIRLKWLERNESAGLYTPRSLIRKCKIYSSANGKEITKDRPVTARREQQLQEGEMPYCKEFKAQIRSLSLWSSRPCRGLTCLPYSRLSLGMTHTYE